MKKRGLLEILLNFLIDKRRDNHHILFDILLCLAITANLKIKTSLMGILFAANGAKLLVELG